MVSRSHTAAKFTSKIWIVLTTLLNRLFLFAKQIGTNSCRRTERLKIERFVVIACRLRSLLIPKTVGIVTIKRYHLTERHRSAQFGPPRTCIEWQIKTDILSYSLQCHKIFPSSPVFVVKLSCDDRTSVLPLQPLNLSENLAIQILNHTHEHWILLSHFTSLTKYPVRNSAIANFAMAERSKTQNQRHVLLLAHLNKSA